MSAPQTFQPSGGAKYLSTATDIIKLTKGEAAPVGTRALLVGTAGTANIKMVGRNALRTDVPLPAGVVPLAITFLETGGTADDIWALL